MFTRNYLGKLGFLCDINWITQVNSDKNLFSFISNCNNTVIIYYVIRFLPESNKNKNDDVNFIDLINTSNFLEM